MTTSELKVGFIGAGQMSSAIIRGCLKGKVLEPSQVMASDAFQPMLDNLNDTGVATSSENKDVAKFANVVVLAVKPDIVKTACEQIRDCLSQEHLVISIAAGIQSEKIESYLPGGSRVVRVMPNTPCLVSETAAAVSLGKHATKADTEVARSIFSSIGLVVELPEAKLDAVTGLSGSGPAYVFLMIEAMADGGVKAGLPRPIAMKLAAQTVLGSAKMVLETGKHPGELKDAVCSPAGTTIAGVSALEDGGFRAAVINAVNAAANRSKELAKL